VRIGNESIVENLTLEGNFTLLREFLSAESPWPLTATGDKLVIQSESSDRSNVYLVGQPAKISVGSGWVVAKELQLSQNDQLFWTPSPLDSLTTEHRIFKPRLSSLDCIPAACFRNSVINSASSSDA
jgi:hypothetical protein